jgi:hypothetical protein
MQKQPDIRKFNKDQQTAYDIIMGGVNTFISRLIM